MCFCVRASFRMIERAREKRTDREGVREVREEHKDLSVCVYVYHVWFPGGVVVSTVCFHPTGWLFKSYQG